MMLSMVRWRQPPIRFGLIFNSVFMHTPQRSRKPSSPELPLVHRFSDHQSTPTVEQAFVALQDEKGLLMLHSSNADTSEVSEGSLGRYSFLMADPFDTIIVDRAAPQRDSLAQLRNQLNQWETPSIPGLPPMLGGIAGLFSYELNSGFENVPRAKHDTFPVPALMLGLYDCVIAWDHHLQDCMIISQGFPETQISAREKRAQQRIDWCLELLQNHSNSPPALTVQPSIPPALSQPSKLPKSSPQYEVAGPPGLTSDFSKPQYIDAVNQCVQYIYAGDVFQINLAQQLRMPATCKSLELFEQLCHCNPAPFSAYYQFEAPGFAPTEIISASPERLVSVRDRIVETRPIKGTRPRTGQPLVDIQARQDLLSSAKDAAENTMIVDLMRNDLSRVCDDDSVVVPQLCALEEYASVMHLVSSVQGKLRPDCDLTDLIAAIFPGGSITGAPKVRAMELIAELEPNARGAYCGSLGYLGFDGNADLNILIRTATAQNGWWQIPVGGGIVSQSSPQAEYEETWTKAAGMLRATHNNSKQGVGHEE